MRNKDIENSYREYYMCIFILEYSQSMKYHASMHITSYPNENISLLHVVCIPTRELSSPSIPPSNPIYDWFVEKIVGFLGDLVISTIV